jgi:hypothetical protein
MSCEGGTIHRRRVLGACRVRVSAGRFDAAPIFPGGRPILRFPDRAGAFMAPARSFYCVSRVQSPCGLSICLAAPLAGAFVFRWRETRPASGAAKR